MGETQSKLPTPPPPPPKRLTDTPWRQPSNWNKQLEQSLLEEVRGIDPKEKTNVLFVGPVGAGKTSFIDSALSVGKGHKVDRAYTGAVHAKSYTSRYKKYTEEKLLQKVRLWDMMGIELLEDDGFNVQDFVALLKGHVKNGYDFNPRSPISESHSLYREDPKFKHQIHCVVFVADSVIVNADFPRQFANKMKELQREAKRLCIPRVMILTKTDKLCPEVEKDVGNMFRSIRAKQAVMLASEVFNIPQASIHPVKNYELDYEIDWKTNIPILLALRQMMQYAEDRVETLHDKSDSDGD